MLGVLGGMGPAATVDFLGKLVAMTAATRDQDHVPAIVYSVPQIPDRVSAILDGATDPLPALSEGLARLEAAGASAIAMPCNTAHYWHAALARQTHVPILHIVDAVLAELPPTPCAIGLLATTATLTAGLYKAGLEAAGHTLVVPGDQAGVMDAIRAVKAGRIDGARTLLESALVELHDAGCAQIILGCTELPLVLAGPEYVDATAALVRACIRHFGRALLQEPQPWT